jgi:lipopolysaccharide/colanic/teichoic acid biosynthesis glycosyltransferase
MHSKSYLYLKRLFDIVFSVIGLIIFSPVFLLAPIFIKADSKGTILYKAKRAGQNGKNFVMYKFRTMVEDADQIGGPSTSADDPRMTKVGNFLRKYKLDEAPQFINILKGDMSFVGPRPEVPSEIETYDPETRKTILSVKPGLTDLASIAGLHEEEILRGAADPHLAYRELIQPQKIKLQLEYIKNNSFWQDIKILTKTFLNVFSNK